MMALDEGKKRFLEEKYYDPKFPGSLSGPIKFYNSVKNQDRFNISKSDVRKYLRSQPVYTANRNIQRKFKRNRVIVAGLDDQWDMDLIDFTKYNKQNDGNKYILVCIDVFSRYVWTRPLKTKYGVEIASNIISIINEGRRPKAIRTDGGREFSNKTVNSEVYEPQKINHFVTANELQSNYCERVIKTLKSKLFRIMRRGRKFRYIDSLSDVVEGYNKTIHSSTGISPEEVNSENENEVRFDQYQIRNKKLNALPRKKKRWDAKTKAPYNLKIGSHVRVTKTRSKFQRFYDENWTGEVFKITKRFRREGIKLYKIEDLSGDPLAGSFYENELQKIDYNPNSEFQIDKVLKTIKKKGKPDTVLVSWHDWPPKFNSIIPKANINLY